MGLMHARRLLSEGAKMVISDKNQLSKIDQEEIGDKTHFVSHDVASESDWKNVVEVACSEFGGVDILVNNAGIYTAGSFEEETADRLRNVLDVNVVGAWLGIQCVAPVMAKGGGGSIINVSSIAAIRGMPNLSVYGCSKGALCSLTRHAAIELGDKKIRVNTILPGAIDGTGMYQQGSSKQVDNAVLQGTPLKCFGRSDDVSALVAYLASDESSFITGSEQVIDGGRSV
jgi:3alpha(or 20beta)-hydroxysteroid dehydrogenase